MRTIEYRGYDKIADTWCFGTPVKDQDVKGRYWIMFNESEGAIIDNPETIGEFTGLKDKNGKEIFEGDVVRDHWCDFVDDTYTVEFSEGAFYPLVYVEEGYNCIDKYNSERFEVIGNIHENPELL